MSDENGGRPFRIDSDLIKDAIRDELYGVKVHVEVVLSQDLVDRLTSTIMRRILLIAGVDEKDIGRT